MTITDPMIINNHCQVTKALLYLKDGLMPFVSQEFRNHYKSQMFQKLKSILGELDEAENPFQPLDIKALLQVMDVSWSEVYRGMLEVKERKLNYAGRSLVKELQYIRNLWAHQHMFSNDDTYRALDSTCRLLALVPETQASEKVKKAKIEVLRMFRDEHAEFAADLKQQTAIKNDAQVALAMKCLRFGLISFLSQKLVNRYIGQTNQELQRILSQLVESTKVGELHSDVAKLLRVMWRLSKEAYIKMPKDAVLSLVSELQSVHNRRLQASRNGGTYQQPFSTDDAYRTLDSTHRLLVFLSSPQAAEVEKAKRKLLPMLYDGQTGAPEHKSAQESLDSPTDAKQKPRPETVVVLKGKGEVIKSYGGAKLVADLYRGNWRQQNKLKRLGRILKRKRKGSSS